MRRFVVGLAVGLAMALAVPAVAQSPSAIPGPDASAVPCVAPAPSGDPVELKGGKQEAGNTKKFLLAPGDYHLVLKGKAKESSNVILTVVGPGMPDYDSVWNEMGGPGAYEFETYLYEVEGGDYYVEYDLPLGPWTLTLTPE